MSLTLYPLLSFFDCVDYTLDQCLGGDASPRNRRQAVRAVEEAYYEIPSLRQWRCYWKPFTIQTVAAQTSSTISYTYTGGTYERMVTLASGSWPIDADKWALVVSGQRYRVDRYKSSSVITLDEKDCPTTDLVAGTGYTLVRDTYDLPAGCRQIDYMYDVNAPGRMIPAVNPDNIMRERRLVKTSSVPLMYSVFVDERYSSSMALHFAPSVRSVRTYQGMGLFRPADLRVLDYSGNGTVATTNGSSTVTGTSTAFTNDHLTCIMRFGADTKIPTGLAGETEKNRLNPFAMQRVVRDYISGTSLTLEQPADQTLSGVGYRISSKIDIEPGAMRNAFLRCCEARFSTQDRKGAQEREARYQQALQRAMFADQRMMESPDRNFLPTSLQDVASSITLTTGGP